MSATLVEPHVSVTPKPFDHCPELSTSPDSLQSKPSRFGSLKMLPTQEIPNRRSSSGAQSFVSVGSTEIHHTRHRFGKSIGNLIASPASWTRKHWPHYRSETSSPSSPSANVPKLNEKYGNYVKPSKKASTKAAGATNKNNIGSGATAVIRLVRSGGRTLAVKEFRKRDKTEDEKEYLKRMHNEYCISKAVSGNINVVETMDLVVDEHDRWCTVMEYVSSRYEYI